MPRRKSKKKKKTTKSILHNILNEMGQLNENISLGIIRRIVDHSFVEHVMVGVIFALFKHIA